MKHHSLFSWGVFEHGNPRPLFSTVGAIGSLMWLAYDAKRQLVRSTGKRLHVDLIERDEP